MAVTASPDSAAPAKAQPLWGLAAVVVLLLAGALLLDSPVVVAERAQVEAMTAAATPRITGRITRLLVEEGTRVRAGETLALLGAGELADGEALAAAALSLAKAGLPVSQTAAALQEVQRRATTDQAAAALVAAQADVSANRARAAQAASIAESRRAGLARGVVADQEVVAAEADERAAQALVEAAIGRVRVAEAALNLARRQAGLDSVEGTTLVRNAAEIRQAEVALAIARRQREHAAILAPADGVVARKLVAIGDQVVPGQPVYTVLTDSERWIRAEISEINAPAVRLGALASVTIDALPNHVWTGKVARIGIMTELPDPLVGRTAPTVALMIALDAAAPTIPAPMPGMTARVRIARSSAAGWGLVSTDAELQPSDPIVSPSGHGRQP